MGDRIFENDLVIIEAIEKNNVLLTRSLKDSDYDFNKAIPYQNSVGSSSILPVSLACAWGSVEIVKYLIDIGVDANIPGTDGKLPIHYTCDSQERADERKAECTRALDILVRNNCDVNAVDNMGRTALFLACEADDVEAVRLLVQNSCDVNIQSVFGDSPLKISCRNAKYWSYWQGKDPHSSEKRVNASNFPPVQITKMLLQARADLSDATMLPTAVQLGDIQMVQELLILGMDINMLDENMCTPLGIACSSVHVSPCMVKLLLDSGADVNRGGGWKRQKPIIFSYVHNSVEKLKLLLSYGAQMSREEMTEMVSLTLSKSILENPEVIGPSSKELLSWRLLMLHGFTPVVIGTEIQNKLSQLSICSSFDKISPWLWGMLFPVRSLKEICRISIRSNIQTPIDENLVHLPIPNSVKEYLKINEIRNGDL